MVFLLKKLFSTRQSIWNIQTGKKYCKNELVNVGVVWFFLIETNKSNHDF